MRWGSADGRATGGAPAAGPVRIAEIETVFEFVVDPLIGIAPFSNCAPSAGESRVSAGASATLNGTVMNTRAGVSAVLPVSASSALMSNWLRPRRSSTSTCQLPAESADSR